MILKASRHSAPEMVEVDWYVENAIFVESQQSLEEWLQGVYFEIRSE